MTDNKNNEDDVKLDEESTEVCKEDLDRLKEEIEESEREKEEFKDQLLRLRADFMNFKKRAEKSKQDTITYALESFIGDILPILDNFERALESNENKEDSFYEGINLIYMDLKKLLEKNNVEEIDSLGEEFNPNLHHAVFMEESEDYDENKVIEVLQRGYRMKDRVIRPAMVKVSK